MRLELNEPTERSKTLLVLGMAFGLVLVIGFVLWMFLRSGEPTPEEIAKSHIDDKIDEIGEEIAGFLTLEIPIISRMVEELDGEYLEDLIHDVVAWDYSEAIPAVGDEIYEVKATALIPLDLDVPGLIKGEVDASLPFRILVDMDKRSVVRHTPLLADASISSDFPAIGALSSVISRASDMKAESSKTSDIVKTLLTDEPSAPIEEVNGDIEKVVEEGTDEDSDSLVAADMERCVFAALEDELSDILIEKIEETDPQTLTDMQRWEWSNLLEEVSNGYEVMVACEDLWSEPVTAENADRRNNELRAECVDQYERNRQDYGYYSPEYTYSSDVIELLERPYLSLGVTDRLVLRMLLTDSGYCDEYYPQLFFGRWVPVFDRNN